MVLRSSYIHKLTSQHKTSGFTLLEVMVVVTIVSICASLSLFFTVSSFKQQARQSEVDAIATYITESRNMALQNQTTLPHGIALYPDDYLGYVQFVGESYSTSEVTSRVFIPGRYELLVGGSSTNEVVFTSPFGTTTPVVIIFSDQQSTATTSLTINYEGFIE